MAVVRLVGEAAAAADKKELLCAGFPGIDHQKNIKQCVILHLATLTTACLLAMAIYDLK